MTVQEQRPSARVFPAHVEGEFVEIGDVSMPIINPHQGWIVDIAYGTAMPAVFKEAHGISGEEEIPDHLAVFGGEFSEPV